MIVKRHLSPTFALEVATRKYAQCMRFTLRGFGSCAVLRRSGRTDAIPFRKCRSRRQREGVGMRLQPTPLKGRGGSESCPLQSPWCFYSTATLESKGGTMAPDKNKKTFNDVPSELIRRFPRGPVDWAAVLAELEAKRAALDKAIASLRSVIATGVLFGVAEDAMPAMADSVGVRLHGGEVPIGAFLGKSIPEAAKLCLQILKKKLTTREIVDALLKGGIETTAKTSFPSIVHSILMRTVRSGGGIVKLDRSHWGLAEWYPRGLASTIRASSKKRQKTARKPKEAKHLKEETEAPKRPTNKGSDPDPAGFNFGNLEAYSAGGDGVSVPEKIKAVLSKAGAELSAQEVAAKIGTKSNVAAMLLAKMAKLGDAEKTVNGKYRAIKAA